MTARAAVPLTSWRARRLRVALRLARAQGFQAGTQAAFAQADNFIEQVLGKLDAAQAALARERAERARERDARLHLRGELARTDDERAAADEQPPRTVH